MTRGFILQKRQELKDPLFHEKIKCGMMSKHYDEKTDRGRIAMKIYVDADACPVVGMIERVARQNGIPVMLLCDTNHILHSDYSEIKIIGAGADAVDFALVNMCTKYDIVVTQDYGVAAMALGRGAYAIHQSGKWYTDENIDQMLMERHLNKKARRASGRNRIKGSRKRTQEDNINFRQSFEKLIKKAVHEKADNESGV